MENTSTKIAIVIAHYADRIITKDECTIALPDQVRNNVVFVDFQAEGALLSKFDLPFENIALSQRRKFNQVLKPILDKYPDSLVYYFGLVPVSVGFHLGFLLGNTRRFVIFQWHHSSQQWFESMRPPGQDYTFKINRPDLPSETQKGKGDVIIRISTSFNVDRHSTYAVVPNPVNEFDIDLETPHIDSLFSQENITNVVEAFQDVLNCYANKLADRGEIHLFISSSAGLPFALGTRINPTVYPFVQTYQYSRNENPQHREAILVTAEVEERLVLSEEDRRNAIRIRSEWNHQLTNEIRAFIDTVAEDSGSKWLETICSSQDLKKISPAIKGAWQNLPNIGLTSLKSDHVTLDKIDVEDGFDYNELNNSWALDDGFLVAVDQRFLKNGSKDSKQAGRLFFFHEGLHYSRHGHNLNKTIAVGIGQFPKVIEEADYQADVWALLNEYKFSKMYHSDKIANGVKQFFCDAIDTAVETMWSFVDTGSNLNMIQIRSMNRFLNWYWQWLRVEALSGQGSIEEVIEILFNKPIIEFAGAPMDLRGNKTYFKLNLNSTQNLQLATFTNNRVHRFQPNAIDDIVDGFRSLNGDKIKSGLKAFQSAIFI